MIRAGLLQSTFVVLPAEEKVATVFGGDTVIGSSMAATSPADTSRVKPKVANATTDIHIVSDHGNEYTLELREVSSDGRSSLRFQDYLSTLAIKAAKDKLAEMPVFVPAAELDKAKREATPLKPRKQQNDRRSRKRRLSSIAANIRAAALRLHMGPKEGEALGLQQMWRDDKFTYLRGHFQETPAFTS